MTKAMSYDDILALTKGLYPVNDVATGCSYWIRTLTEKCLGMFTYDGLPDSLPVDEMEIRLIQRGYCVVFKHSTKGIVTSYGGLSNFDEYYRPTMFVYAQPVLGSGNLKLHEKAAIIYNSQVDILQPVGFYEMIRRYARTLADIESSLNICTVNTRNTTWDVANSENVAKSVYEARMKQEKGEFGIITDIGLIDNFKSLPVLQGKNDSIPDLLAARESTLRAFYQEIGIRSATQKKERLITDEVSSDTQMLIVNQADMLRHRQRGIDEINKLFDTKITVDIAEEYKPINPEQGDIINDNN